jgi:hypothetical protein
MRASKRGELPDDLSRGRSRFQAWRQGRKIGRRIPPALWDLAVELAKVHGVSRTAQALSVDYYSLKQRTETAASTQAPALETAFIELPAPALLGKHCLFELNNAAGATLRVQLVGYDTADVETLARAVWSTE